MAASSNAGSSAGEVLALVAALLESVRALDRSQEPQCFDGRAPRSVSWLNKSL
jgi:hypothetical protein